MVLCKLTNQKLEMLDEHAILRLEYNITGSAQLSSFCVWFKIFSNGVKEFNFDLAIAHSNLNTSRYDPKECDAKQKRLARTYFAELKVNDDNSARIGFTTQDKAQALYFIRGVQRLAPFAAGQFKQLSTYINTSGLPFEPVFEKIERLVEENKLQKAFAEAQLADSLGDTEVLFKLGQLFKNLGYKQPAYVSFINVAKENPHYQSAQLEAAQLVPHALAGGMGQVLTHSYTAGEKKSKTAAPLPRVPAEKGKAKFSW